ncbi:hypothetical protein KKI90_21285 [Xenorhabdus bovienii]|uniref:hypothetical protein n=1 Tax=Xenorhabdus bovienii TaxID=40576 RepID=UPI00237CF388|nr:hypothetical protein [Xenorhabdus bovienii]MDE1486493.1 hypothetical protein [Xenorhabdus bovienii]MDE9477388.1 hypothetical protein [Xenorhabdus bovienii]MDE9530269.1 hypothetical protein [Xenorhabdus bovienii]
MEDKVKIPKSDDFKRYFADNFGIVESSVDGVELYDLILLSKESYPILLNKAENDDTWTASLAAENEYEHICSIRVTPTLLRRLQDVISRTPFNKK